MKKSVFLAVLMFLTLPLGAMAATWYVKTTGVDSADCSGGTSWDTAFATIQRAINCAQEGDEIWVAEGTYTVSQEITLNKAISLYGGFAGNESTRDERDWRTHKTIVDGNNSVRCFYVNADGRIDGFDIRNGYDGWYGGGIYNYNSSPTIANCNIYQNYAGVEGAGIYNFAISSSSPTIINCNIYKNNSNGNGGGIFNNDHTAPIIKNCNIYENYAKYYGGGIVNHYSEPTIENCNIYKNEASWYAGGILNHSYDDKPPVSPIIKNCNIYENSATEYNGGGIESYYANPTIENCNIYKNKAPNGGGIASRFSSGQKIINCKIYGNEAEYGGGIYNFNSSSTIKNCDIYENTSSKRGGGISNHSDTATNITIINCNIYRNSAAWSGGGIHNASTSPSIINCTIYDNEVSPGSTTYLGGGGIYNYNSSPSITNSIIWLNRFQEALSQIENSDSSSPSVTYSDIQGGYAGEGNIDADPMFKDPANGDFHLLPGSPCIDTGTNEVEGLPETAFEGDPRTLDGNGDAASVTDMGADEFVPMPDTYELELMISADEGASGWIIGTVNCGDDEENYEFECYDESCTEEIGEGCSVELEAIAGENSQFAGWDGDCAAGEVPNIARIDNMDGDKWCMAHFELIEQNNPPDMPYNPNPDHGAIDVPYENTSFSWLASDPDGDALSYTFHLCGMWDEETGCLNQIISASDLSDPSYTLSESLTPNTTYWWWVEACDIHDACTSSPVWTFTTAPPPPTMYNLNVIVNPEEGGTVTNEGISCPEDCSEDYQEGTEVTLTANPAEGYVFLNWTGDCSACGNNTTCTITMDGDKNCMANFELGNQPPNAPQNPSPADGATGVDYHQVNFSWQATDPDGDALTYNFYFGQPGEGTCIFESQQIGLTQSSYSLTDLNVMTQYCWQVEACDAEHCTAGPIWTFTTQGLVFYTLSVSIDPEDGGQVIDIENQPGGINCPDQYCVLGYGEGRSVTLQANPAAGYQFVSWTGDCAPCGDDPTCQFVMDSDKSCMANFEEIPPGPKPDLVITKLVTPRYWRYGRKARVSVLIKNQGEADITQPFKVKLFTDQDTAENKLVETTVDGLTAGQSKLLRFRFQISGELCDPTNEHTLFVVVDSDESVLEIDETNNEASKNIILHGCP